MLRISSTIWNARPNASRAAERLHLCQPALVVAAHAGEAARAPRSCGGGCSAPSSRWALTFQFQVHDLAADHAVRADRLADLVDHRQDDLGLDALPPADREQRGERHGVQRVARQQRHALAEYLVVGELPPPVVIVVHAGQVVVDQGKRVDHLDGRPDAVRGLPPAAAGAKRQDGHGRTDALPAGEDAVAHGLVDDLRRHGGLRQQFPEVGIDFPRGFAEERTEEP
jgi:hypothetical protein